MKPFFVLGSITILLQYEMIEFKGRMLCDGFLKRRIKQYG